MVSYLLTLSVLPALLRKAKNSDNILDFLAYLEFSLDLQWVNEVWEKEERIHQERASATKERWKR